MTAAIRMGHITLETPDIERQIEYFTSIVGLFVAERGGGRAFLTSRVGQLAVELNAGEHARCKSVSLEVAPGLSSSEIVRSLDLKGFRAAPATDRFPGAAEAVRIDDNNGVAVDLFSGGAFLTPNRPTTGVGPVKLGHVAMTVPDPKATADFYTQSLGFRVSDWIMDFFVFQRCNPDHHTLNFVKGDHAKLAHFAFELKDFAHLQNACDILGQNRIQLARGPLRHGPGHNVAIYSPTPDGLILEFFIEMDRMSIEEIGYFDPKPWHRDFPQRPKVWSRENNGTVIWGIRIPH